MFCSLVSSVSLSKKLIPSTAGGLGCHFDFTSFSAWHFSDSWLHFLGFHFFAYDNRVGSVIQVVIVVVLLVLIFKLGKTKSAVWSYFGFVSE